MLRSFSIARYHEIAEDICQLIAKRRLQPGDPLPSERELIQALDASYCLVRLANQHLIERGIIDRQHGRGTFLARDPAKKQRRSPRHQRLALLYVNHPLLTHPFIEHLTLDLQRVASLRGYELLIGAWDSPHPEKPPFPFGLDPRRVDGVLLHGHPTTEHLAALDAMALPVVVVGNTALPDEAPQIRPDGYQVTYEIARELLQAGYGPIWLDGNPAYTQHATGLARIAGYAAALRDHGDGPLRLCDVQAPLLEKAVETLLTEDLDRAALIVHDWSAPLLITALRMRSPQAERLLLVPASYRLISGHTPIGPSMMQWTRRYGMDLFAEAAVHGLVDVIEGHRERFAALELNVRCKLLTDTDPPRMQARWFLHPVSESHAARALPAFSRAPLIEA